MIKEIKYGGYTATPSDYECPDGELSAAINLVPEEGELVATSAGELIYSLPEYDEVVFIHIVNDGTKHLIIKRWKEEGVEDTMIPCYKLGYCVYEDGTLSTFQLIKDYGNQETLTKLKCSATGNVLCVYCIGEMEHWFFYNGSYTYYNAADLCVPIWFGVDITEAGAFHSKEQLVKAVAYNLFGGKMGKWRVVASTSVIEQENYLYLNDLSLHGGEIYRINPVFDMTDKSKLDDDKLYTVQYKTSESDSYNSTKMFFTYGLRPQFKVPSQTEIVSIRAYRSSGIKFIKRIDLEILESEYEEENGSAQVIDPWTGDLPYASFNNYPNDWSGWNSHIGDGDNQRIEKNNDGDYRTWIGYNSCDEVNNAVYGLANSLIAEANRTNRFVLPFFLRYGFRLISGDIICVSPPILIEPNAYSAPVIQIDTQNGSLQNMDGNTDWGGANKDFPGVYQATVSAKAYFGKLMYAVKDKQKLQTLLQQENMIDSLVIAVSDPIYLYKQSATNEEISSEAYISHNPPSVWSYDKDDYYLEHNVYDSETEGAFIKLPQYTDYEKRLSEVSAFKIVKEIRAEDIQTAVTESNPAGWADVFDESDNSILGGLGGITSLMPDNTESLSTYDATSVQTYNQREHWLGVEKTIFNGFDLDCMSGFVSGGVSSDENYKVTIKDSDTGQLRDVVHGKMSVTNINRRWLYYPSLNAREIVLYYYGDNHGVDNQIDVCCDKYSLNKHPHLNGAYRFSEEYNGDIYYYGDENVTRTVNNETDLVNTPKQAFTESDKNMLYVSVQANPILIDQRIRVGDGILLAGAINTKPISRGQYGQVPLFAFSTDGIWAIEVSQDGTYSARQPSSRDVLLNEKSITPIDNAILFTSERGIMMLTSADHDALCISKEINTKHPFNLSDISDEFATYISEQLQIPLSALTFVPFKGFLQDCRMVYDYVHQCIIAYNPSYSYSYVYSLEDKKWGMRLSDIKYALNAYPEAWIVNGNNDIINLSGEPDEDEESEEQTGVTGLLITRPLKLDHPDMMKTVDTIIQRGMFRHDMENPHIKSILYGSRDLFNWFPVYSSTDHYLRGFRGTPYKFFRIVLLTNLKKDESIFGCTIQYTPRLINKLR